MRPLLGLTFILTLLILGQSCNLTGDSVTTPSGIKVKFLKRGDGELPAFDDILHFNLMYKDHRGKVMYNSRTRRTPYKIRNIDLLKDTESILGEVLRFCNIGDSVTFKVPYGRFYKAVFNQECPDEFKNEFAVYHAALIYSATLDEIMGVRKSVYDSSRAVTMTKESIHRKIQHKTDSGILAKHFVQNNIIGLNKTDGGAYFKINKAGKGVIAKKGSTVTVQYTGSLLNGTHFYSSYNDPYPLSFVLGFQEEIQGWDETIVGMREGTSATLYVPSTLAYGNHQSGPIVSPNSILVYEIEILKVQ